MDHARNVATTPDRPPGLPVALRRALGAMLLGGTMYLAGLLALWRAVAETFRW